jgi:hypothetical protein
VLTVALLEGEAPGIEGRSQMTVTDGRPAAGSTRASVTMPVGEFLLRRIREAGVSHAFGVPGDYNLELWTASWARSRR